MDGARALWLANLGVAYAQCLLPKSFGCYDDNIDDVSFKRINLILRYPLAALNFEAADQLRHAHVCNVTQRTAFSAFSSSATLRLH